MIYFDNSATTQPSDTVLSSFVEVNQRYFGNPASLHSVGREAEVLLEKSREQITKLLGSDKLEVIFTSGGTEANNIAILGFAHALSNRGKHIITTKIEHSSVLKSIQSLEKQGFEVDYLSVDEQGLISLTELIKLLRKDTILVSIMHVNNEIGTIQPLEKCAEIIKKNSRAIFHSDTVQSFGKLPVHLTELGPDVISISAHKIHGIKGSGVLVMKKGVKPISTSFGGGQENGLRSGTVSVANAVAIAKAMRISVEESKVESFQRWRNRLIASCSRSSKVLILAKDAGAPHILSIAFKGIKGEVAVNYFQENDILISTSSACSSKSGKVGHVIEAIGVPVDFKDGVVRISFGNNNSEQQIAIFEEVFAQFIELLERGTK